MGYANKAQQAREAKRRRQRQKRDLRNRSHQGSLWVMPIGLDGRIVLEYRRSGSASLVTHLDGVHSVAGLSLKSAAVFWERWPNVKKPTNRAALDPDGNPVLKPSDKDYELLHEYLTHGKYDDGTKRQRSTVSISYSDGAFKACIRDKDQTRCLWVASGTICDLLLALEMALHADDAEWRFDRFASEGPGHAGKKR